MKRSVSDLMPAVQLSIPPLAEHVRTARLVAGAAARRCGVDEDVLDEVRLAVGEACARAVRRSEPAVPGGEGILIRMLDGDDQFTVEVREAGVCAEPEADGGMALALINALAPVSSLTEAESGNLLRMSWPVRPVLPTR